jgi:hypothetical protein
MTGERIDQRTDEEFVDVRGMTDDEVVNTLLDQQAALAIADRIRAGAAAGGDTVADRGHRTRTNPCTSCTVNGAGSPCGRLEGVKWLCPGA